MPISLNHEYDDPIESAWNKLFEVTNMAYEIMSKNKVVECSEKGIKKAIELLQKELRNKKSVEFPYKGKFEATVVKDPSLNYKTKIKADSGIIRIGDYYIAYKRRS